MWFVPSIYQANKCFPNISHYVTQSVFEHKRWMYVSLHGPITADKHTFKVTSHKANVCLQCCECNFSSIEADRFPHQLFLVQPIAVNENNAHLHFYVKQLLLEAQSIVKHRCSSKYCLGSLTDYSPNIRTHYVHVSTTLYITYLNVNKNHNVMWNGARRTKG